MQRNRKQTRLEILNAVGRLLARSGFRELGVNSIAREAGVDKVLIYRYFGGLPELLKAFAEETDFWPDLEELERETETPSMPAAEAERANRLVLAFGRALRRRPLTQEILRWELLERNELTYALDRYREEQGTKVFRHIEESDESAIDIRAVGSLLAAGLTYLILRSKTVDVYNGLHLQSEEDWARIERAAGFLVEAAFDAIGGKNVERPRKPRRKTHSQK
ncbi:MAG TPA: TetR/AcrR family transcriptional regulator [Bryobacteraceae bacterium]|jgi:AcrR family transcriptional regulator|nr:TetR/AcrR family transcriptional regulator [Bryobacteraceae bacterium]